MPKKQDAKLRKVNQTHKPIEMSLDDWQVRLRQDLAAGGNFRLTAEGKRGAPAWNFQVRNLDNHSVYKVEIRSEARYENFCSCPDYAINTLGTCKHLEFTLRKLKKDPQRRRVLAHGVRLAAAEVGVYYGATQSLIFREGSKSSSRALSLARGFFRQDATGLVLNEIEPLRFGRFVEKFRETDSVLHVRADAEEIINDSLLRKHSESAVHSLFPSGLRSTAWKGLLNVELYPYQREGALFAASRGRAFIADEMGLGKTVQALAATEILRRACGIQRVLIICPTSLKHQWRSEIERFSGQSTEVIEGLASKRQEQLKTPSFFKIINYDLVHRELEQLGDWRPDYVILDEAQRIKNWKTKASHAVKKLNSRFCLVLTGTPLENRIEELHSLMEFVDQFRFGPLFRFLHEHQITDADGKIVGYGDLDRIHSRLRDVLIRRTKAQVLKQLPARIEKTLLLPMTPEQTELHAEHAHVVAQLVAKWKRLRFLTDRDQKRLMTALQFMRMSCNSTYLLNPTTNFQKKFTELGQVLSELLAVKENKVVLFSQWLRTHELITEMAKKRHWNSVFFHGSLTGSQRRDVIETFRTDPKCRLFLATDAGGVGLNLQFANVVINMDQPWNPAVLEQRVGRIHRIGQTRPVQVLNFVSRGSIEEGMLRTIDFKRSIFSGVLDGEHKQVLLGGSRLARFIENVDEAAQASAHQPTNAHEAEQPKPEFSASLPTAPPSLTHSAPVVDQWAEILRAGAQLLQQLVPAQAATLATKASSSAVTASVRIERDEKLGELAIKIKAPPPEVVATLVQALQSWLIPAPHPLPSEDSASTQKIHR